MYGIQTVDLQIGRLVRTIFFSAAHVPEIAQKRSCLAFTRVVGLAMPKAEAAAPLLDASVEAPSSTQPAPCCTDGAHPPQPAPDTSQLRGAFETLVSASDTAECYVVAPPAGTAVKGGVLVVHDIFGLHSGRHAQFCDELAAEGFVAVCPDCYGDARERAAAMDLAWPPKQARNILAMICCCKFSWMSKVMKIPWADIEPRLFAAISRASQLYAGAAAAAPQPPVMPLYAYGFCWGAWPVARLLANEAETYPAPPGATGPPLPSVRAGMCYHPSFQVGGDVAELAAAVKRPLLLCPCGDDPQDVQDGGLVTQQLEQAGRTDFKVHPFPAMVHGFMMRGPLEQPEIQASYEKGKSLALEFIAQHSAPTAVAAAPAPAPASAPAEPELKV